MYTKQLNRQLGAQRAPAAAAGVVPRPAQLHAVEAPRARSAAPAKQAKASLAPTRRSRSRQLTCQVANVAAEPKRAAATDDFKRGKHWHVHKFGGTCMANADRIKAVSQLMVDDPSQKVVVVSAMGSHPTSPLKVTDLILNMIKKAANQDAAFLVDLAALQDKHVEAAKLLLGESPELTAFIARLLEDISNLKAMLQAICIGARRALLWRRLVVLAAAAAAAAAGACQAAAARSRRQALAQAGGDDAGADQRHRRSSSMHCLIRQHAEPASVGRPSGAQHRAPP
jgi:hypothetical protein